MDSRPGPMGPRASIIALIVDSTLSNSSGDSDDILVDDTSRRSE